MRKLFMLRGAPGSGKNTMLDDAGLLGYSVGFDDARALLSGPHPTTDGPSLRVGQDVNKRAVEFVREAVDMRMRRGETVIVNNTNAVLGEVTRWAKAAHRFGFEPVVVDMHDGLDLAELRRRNAHRAGTADFVPDETVARMHELIESNPVPDDVARTIAPRELLDELSVPVRDWTGFKRVIVIGDVQGCASALSDLLTEIDPTDRDKIVLLGDLFDRGVENPQVLDVVTYLADRGAELVMGNHDHHLLELVAGTNLRSYSDTRASLRQIGKSGRRAADAAKLVRRMEPYIAAAVAGGTELVLTHGGITAATLGQRIEPNEEMPFGGYVSGLVPDRAFIYGDSAREKVYADTGDYGTDIDALTEAAGDTRRVFFHGHRFTETGTTGVRSFGLESGVEFDGGSLSAAVFDTRTGRTERVTVPNTVTCGPVRERAAKVRETRRGAVRGTELLAAMRADADVREREIPGTGLSSFNFTREAFQRGRWTERTTTARGLFLDSETGTVAGRGYAKFFAVGERPETAREKVLDRFGDGSEVVVEEKLNGFLGLAFVHGGQLRCFTKAGATEFAAEFESLLAEHLADLFWKFTEELGKSKVTLTFEVLSGRDPHIVGDGYGVRLLHAVAPTAEKMLLLDPVADRFAERFGFDRPRRRVVSGRGPVAAALDQGGECPGEGVVLRHLPTGEMVKVKSRGYRAWKSIRTPLNRLALTGEAGKGGDPRSRAALAVADDLRACGHGLDEFLVTGIGGQPVLDIPAIRQVIGTPPAVLEVLVR